MDNRQGSRRQMSALQVFGLVGLTVVTAFFGFVLAFIGAIVISGCIGDCTAPDLSGGIPFFVGAALAGATSVTSTYWMTSREHRRAGVVFASTALIISVPLTIWATVL